MRTNLPTTLLIAGLALFCAACPPTAHAAEENAHPYGHNYLPETQERHEYGEKLLADIQQAARECSGMEWYARIKGRGGKNTAWQARYPINEVDMAIIRDLLLHKLHTVKYGCPKGVRFRRFPFIPSKRLRFLDAAGNVIYEFEFEDTRMCLGRDSDTDANGYQCFRRLSLPDADYETWQKLIPAKMDEDLDKWLKAARKK